jgi:hypothetical protein
MEFNRKDAERIIGTAATEDAAVRERLTQSEIEDAAADVGIPRDAVRTVIAAETEASQRAAERRERIKRSTQKTFAACFFAVAFALSFYWLGIGFAASGLTNNHNAVEAARANVNLALDNRAMLPNSLATATNDAERATVIERAERRVYVAKRDYDTAARTYNDRASGWFARRVLRESALPQHEPFAATVWR